MAGTGRCPEPDSLHHLELITPALALRPSTLSGWSVTAPAPVTALESVLLGESLALGVISGQLDALLSLSQPLSLFGSIDFSSREAGQAGRQTDLGEIPAVPHLLALMILV